MLPSAAVRLPGGRPGARPGRAHPSRQRDGPHAAGLLPGAARAFAEHGLRRSTMQSIAAAAGVAKATLYNHFRTKDEVAAALLAVELDRLTALAAGLPRSRRWPRSPTSSAPIRCCAGWPAPSRRC